MSDLVTKIRIGDIEKKISLDNSVLGKGLTKTDDKLEVSLGTQLNFNNDKIELNLPLKQEYVGWNQNASLNTFTSSGLYIIEANQRYNQNDGLPITNMDGFKGILIVTTLGEITGQTLILTYKLGSETKTYQRTLNQNDWSEWQVQLGMKELGLMPSSNLDNCIDNGLYTGVLNDTGETFVVMTINNYVIASVNGVDKSVMQYLVGVGIGAEQSIRHRVLQPSGNWSQWETQESGKQNNISIKQGTPLKLEGGELSLNLVEDYDNLLSKVITDESNGEYGLTLSSNSLQQWILGKFHKIAYRNGYNIDFRISDDSINYLTSRSDGLSLETLMLTDDLLYRMISNESNVCIGTILTNYGEYALNLKYDTGGLRVSDNALQLYIGKGLTFENDKLTLSLDSGLAFNNGKTSVFITDDLKYYFGGAIGNNPKQLTLYKDVTTLDTLVDNFNRLIDVLKNAHIINVTNE